VGAGAACLEDGVDAGEVVFFFGASDGFASELDVKGLLGIFRLMKDLLQITYYSVSHAKNKQIYNALWAV
jgi:hypothetical protein